MPRKVIHYLRKERVAAALTQADIAALFGVRWKSRVARYERGSLPPTDYALAYQAIYGKPVSTLLHERYQDVSAEVRERARQLLAQSGTASTARRLRRQRSLERIVAR